MYYMEVFTVCLLSADHISQYKRDILFIYCIYNIIITAILLSRPNLYSAYCHFNFVKCLLLPVCMCPNSSPPLHIAS